MKHLVRYFLVSFLLLVFSTRSGQASRPIPGFDPVGAEQAGMGGAATALTLSPSAMFHNPAGMVYHVISGGFGFQPVRWNEWPRSWWADLYNRTTEYGFPLALSLQGWEAPTPEGWLRNFQAGIPIAYKFSPVSPAAIHLKWAMEETPSGAWITGFPVDFGFLLKTKRGANIGTTLKNVVIGGNRFRTLQTRTDIGIAYEAGVATFSMATSAKTWDEIRDPRDHMRTGFELASNPSIIFRGGYVHWEGGTWWTGGVGLRSPNAGMYVDYAVVWDRDKGGFSHFVQYIYMLQ